MSGLNAYFPKNIANVLSATMAAHMGSINVRLGLARNGEEVTITQEEYIQIYREGYMQAIVALALGFGLRPESNERVQQIVEGKPVGIPAWVETDCQL